jgi:hypothetical protein
MQTATGDDSEGLAGKGVPSDEDRMGRILHDSSKSKIVRKLERSGKDILLVIIIVEHVMKLRDRVIFVDDTRVPAKANQ